MQTKFQNPTTSEEETLETPDDVSEDLSDDESVAESNQEDPTPPQGPIIPDDLYNNVQPEIFRPQRPVRQTRNIPHPKYDDYVWSASKQELDFINASITFCHTKQNRGGVMGTSAHYTKTFN